MIIAKFLLIASLFAGDDAYYQCNNCHVMFL